MRQKRRLGKLILFLVTTLIPLVIFAQGIALDGEFGDWRDKPGIQVYQPWYEPGREHTIKAYADDTELYVLISMNHLGPQGINSYRMLYTVDNGPEKTFHLDPYSNPGGLYIWDYSNGASLISSDGIVVRKGAREDIEGDMAEFRIPLSAMGLEGKNTLSHISFHFPDLGTQCLVIEAGSTAPYIGLGITFVSVAGLALYQTKKKRELV